MTEADNGHSCAINTQNHILRIVKILEWARETDRDTLAERLEERLRECAYSVEVRSGWAANSSQMGAEEFRILLAGGGPTLWLESELDTNGEADPSSLFFSYSWASDGAELHTVENDALATFCSLFWFAEV